MVSGRCNCLPENREHSIGNSRDFFSNFYKSLRSTVCDSQTRVSSPSSRPGRTNVSSETHPMHHTHTRRRCFIRPPPTSVMTYAIIDRSDSSNKRPIAAAVSVANRGCKFGSAGDTIITVAKRVWFLVFIDGITQHPFFTTRARIHLFNIVPGGRVDGFSNFTNAPVRCSARIIMACK